MLSAHGVCCMTSWWDGKRESGGMKGGGRVHAVFMKRSCCWWFSPSAPHSKIRGEWANVWHHVASPEMHISLYHRQKWLWAVCWTEQHLERVDKAWHIFIFYKLPSPSLAVLSLHLFSGGRCHGQREGQCAKNNLNAKTQQQLLWQKSLEQRQYPREGNGAAAAGGRHLTDKKGELCSRIPTALNTGLRDWSVMAEGGERREGR